MNSDSEHPLDVARGIATAVVISLALWLILAGITYLAVRYVPNGA